MDFATLTLSLPETSIKSNIILLSVDETLVCDHSNESLSAVLQCGTVCFPISCKIKFGIFLALTLLGVKGLL